MKKLFSVILVACLAMAMMAVAPVSAANDEVLIGTPTIDGVVDDIYKSSLTIVYNTDVVTNAVEENPFELATATFYALYDGKNVYLCADVKDDDVVSAGDAFVYEHNNPYGNDVVEFRLDLNGGDAFFKIGVDAFGKRAYTIQPDFCDIEEIEYATQVYDDGYVIEVVVPYATLETNDVVSAGKLGLKLWLFDLHADYEGIEAPADKVHFGQWAVDFAGEGPGACVFYNLSEEKAVAAPTADTTTAAPTADTTTAKTEDTSAEPTVDTTTAKTEDTSAKTEDTTTAKTEDTTTAKVPTGAESGKNPTTFDPALIAVVLTAASGAAFVVASKKRH